MGMINTNSFETESMLRGLVKHELAGTFYSYCYLLRQKKVSQALIDIVAKDSGMKRENILAVLEKHNIKVRTRK